MKRRSELGIISDLYNCFPVSKIPDQKELKRTYGMFLSLWTSHLLIEQKSIVGKRLVVVGAQLEDPYPLPQCIIDVLGVRKQLLILRGLEGEYMKHVSFSKKHCLL